MERKIKCEIYRDSMQNYKKYAISPAQLIIADVPYNVGNNFYGSNPMWYKGGDNKNGESKFAGKAAFNSDFNFNLYEYFHFCSKMLKKEDTKPFISKEHCCAGWLLRLVQCEMVWRVCWNSQNKGWNGQKLLSRGSQKCNEAG